MNIYLGNLPYDVREEELRTLFAPFGPVRTVRVIGDRGTGRSKGFAFVEMANREDGERAMKELTGTEIRGRCLNLQEALPRPDRGDSGGRQREKF